MNIYWEEHEVDKLKGKTLSSMKERKAGYDVTGGDGKNGFVIASKGVKPNWFRRACVRFFLGWKWND